MRSACNTAQLFPTDEDTLECHGTGTSLGDPIEVGAVRTVMGANSGKNQPLLFTSAKPNIGHLEGCAGIAGVLKCVAFLQHLEKPFNLHLRQLNPHINVNGFPSFFATEASVAMRNISDQDSVASAFGVSSFGFGGTNAHALL